MRIFVCGGTGYVGRRLVHRFIELGYEVCCIIREEADCFSEDIERLSYCKNDEESIYSEMSKNRYDCVVNLVCSYQTKDALYGDIIESNLTFPLMVLNNAVRCRISNFITIGTGLPEDFNMYSFAKKRFADFGKFYCNKHNINFFELELQMIYGPGEPKNRFLPSSIEKMRNGEDVKLTIGTQKRDIIHIDDVINVIECIINQNVCKGYHSISVGTGDAPTIREIIEYVHELLSSESELLFGAIPMREDEPDCVADIDAMKKMGIYVRYSWKEGLKKMLADEYGRDGK